MRPATRIVDCCCDKYIVYKYIVFFGITYKFTMIFHSLRYFRRMTPKFLYSKRNSFEVTSSRPGNVNILAARSLPIETTVELNNGKQMPVVGLGTFRVTGWNNIYRCVEAALKTGYRLIDTAAVYNNEEDIGKALKELLPKFDLKREDIFITSKLSPSDLRHDKVEKAVMTSCSKLGTSYLDLYLIHWPGAAGVPGTDSINATLRSGVWAALTKLNKKGIVHAIGVSNYTVDHLKKLLSNDYGVQPTVNQVEIHPHYRQSELIPFCKEHNIYVQAYCSLGGSGQEGLLRDPSIEAIARKLQRPSAQILLRWALQNNLLIIPKSNSPERIKANVDLDFSIPEQEMKVLNNLAHQHKYAWDPLTIL